MKVFLSTIVVIFSVPWSTAFSSESVTLPCRNCKSVVELESNNQVAHVSSPQQHTARELQNILRKNIRPIVVLETVVSYAALSVPQTN
jgi:hypothetical protein